LSKDDLTFPVKFFEHLRQVQDVEIIKMIDDIATLALNCIYACDNLDMYEKARNILDSILKDHDGKRPNAINDLLDEMEGELDCMRLLSKYGVRTTLKFIRSNKTNSDVARLLLTQMSRNLSKRYVIHINLPILHFILYSKSIIR